MFKDELLNLSKELANSIAKSSYYMNYLLLKEKIEQDPILSEQIYEFRHAHLNFQMKLLQNDSTSFQDEIYVSKLYSDLIQNKDAMLFLESERENLKLISEIQNTIIEGCKIDLTILTDD